MKASIYVRVSTADQNHELQIRELEDYAARSGWTIAERYLARLRAEGLTIRAIAAKVGVGAGTLVRTLQGRAKSA